MGVCLCVSVCLSLCKCMCVYVCVSRFFDVHMCVFVIDLIDFYSHKEV